MISPGKDETRVCGYICSGFIHWALWITLTWTEYFLFVYHTTSILAKLSTWCFEHSGDISCSLLVNPSHTDESWNDETRVCGYICPQFIHWALWRTEHFLCVHHTSSILAKLSIWCFEHSGDISCSLLVNPNHTDES